MNTQFDYNGFTYDGREISTESVSWKDIKIGDVVRFTDEACKKFKSRKWQKKHERFWNDLEKVQGVADIPLNATGIKQAEDTPEEEPAVKKEDTEAQEKENSEIWKDDPNWILAEIPPSPGQVPEKQQLNMS